MERGGREGRGRMYRRRREVVHCKDTIPKILHKYSRKRNCAAFPISTFCGRFIYSLDRSAYSAAGKYVDRSWEYINRSQTNECGNWDWGRAIPFLGMHKWDFLCSVQKEEGGWMGQYNKPSLESYQSSGREKGTRDKPSLLWFPNITSISLN